ncbi:hypothetical protein [Streptomyces sp. ODS28]|uniref:hypothetical protein n=1 Tax=Streptomyces sp. ODS28 TaxID=3136688 RepID=UPI0031E8CA76
MIRNILGGLLALIGAAAAVLSPFRPWYDGRPGRSYRLDQLFSAGGFTPSQAPLLYGLFAPMAVAALLAVIAVLLRLRSLVVLAGLVVLATAVLWAVRQTQTSNGLYVSDGKGLGLGAAGALGGGIVLLLGALLMRGRRARRAAGRHATPRPAEAPRDDVPPAQPTVAVAPGAEEGPPTEERLWYGTPGATPARGADAPLSDTERTQYIRPVGGDPWPAEPDQDQRDADRTQYIPRTNPDPPDGTDHRDAA